MTPSRRPPKRRSVGLLTLLALVLPGCTANAGAPAASADQAAPTRAPSAEIAPGVVLALEPEVLYLMAPGGGVEAVDAASGELLWASANAARPLAATADWLLAQIEPSSGSGSLLLGFLDPADGSLRGSPVGVALPRGVWAAVQETPEISFALAPDWKEGELLLSWRFLLSWATGVAPPAGAPSYRHRDEGVLRVDPHTRSVEPLPAEAGATVAARWRSGALLAASRMETDGAGERRVVLERWHAESGKALDPVELGSGRVVAHLPSADRRHLLVVIARESPAPGTGAYRWSIFDVADAGKVGELTMVTSATPFCLLGENVLHVAPPGGRRVDGAWVEEPRRLRALAIGDGTEAWHRPLRDPAYRGPRPPAPS